MPGGGGGSRGGGGGSSAPVESAEARALYKLQGQIGRESWDQFKKTGLPALHDYGRMIYEENTPGRISLAENLAAADVAQGYGRARQGIQNSLGRLGVRPGSGRFTSGLRSLYLGEAADRAGARQSARVGVLDRRLNNFRNFIGSSQALLGNTAAVGQAGAGLAGIGAQRLNAYTQQRAANTQALGQLGGSLGSVGLLWAAGAFSDRRLKRNIKEIGQLDNGLTVYEFTYLDEPGTTYTGLMADEVEVVAPQHVAKVGGFGVVNYGGLFDDLSAARAA